MKKSSGRNGTDESVRFMEAAPQIQNVELFFGESRMTASPHTPDAGTNSAAIIELVDSRRSNTHRFRGTNDGSWPLD